MLEIRDEDIELGLVDNDLAVVNVAVTYSAVLLRPFLNETLDAVVVNATDVREGGGGVVVT